MRWVGAILVVLLPTVAAAQMSDDERARQHFEAARSYYDQARYEDAEREFQESFRLSRRVELLVNIATCRERALDFDGAAEMLERYLNERPDAPDRTTVQTRIERLRALAEREGDHPPPPPEGDTAEPAAQGSSGDPTLITAGAVTLAVGGAALIAMIITGAAAHVMYEDLRAVCGEDFVCPEEQRGTRDTGEALAITSTVLTVAGGAAAAAGVVLLVLGLVSSSGESAQLEPDLFLGPGPGLGASLTRRF